MTTRRAPPIPLPHWRHGKVRDVYEVGADRLLLVASDRISAFDVVLGEAIPEKGAVLTQLSAHWFRRFADLVPNHFVTADFDEIVSEVPALAPHRDALAMRSTLVVRSDPVAFECVVRGYLSGSAWAEYRRSGTLAGELLPAGLVESSQLDAPIFSPATKATSGHDENVTFARMRDELGVTLADTLRRISLELFAAGARDAAGHGLIVADTKFEFGLDHAGQPILIDEILTPDSSRFWPNAGYHPGGPQPSFDKQPVRDWLAGERATGRWNGEAPAPALPPDVIHDTTARYLDAFQRLTGRALHGAS
ncbi:MAG: phosphoribosylaminoimidazolesuccinocarboxamide synthase [Gemmatimonadota bacterium]